jgi:gliding motility associated protien GldN
MREIYRTLDLSLEGNGALYYPVEPQGNRMNLFTTLFRLLARKAIKAYEYNLDGTEHFEKSAEIGFRDVLDRFQLYYEMKKLPNRRDSVISIGQADVPSADVLSYFIKEVWYFDQRTSHYGSVITALCPVLHRTESFSDERIKLPMFWVDYAELAPHIVDQLVSVSNYNNVATSTWDDFFTARLYKGDIYKVTNLQNRSLAQYCPTDSAMRKEQQRIEKELADFQKSLYGKDLATARTDTAAVAAADAPATVPKNTKRNTRRGNQKASDQPSEVKSAGKRQSAAPRATVRRQRR